jgi:hypothetical protein
MLTRGGICYDLSISPYIHTSGEITYHFSSENHKQKFIKQQENHRKNISKSLSNRFGLLVEVDILADIVLYKKIESRGFHISTNEGTESCLNNLKCGNLKMTLRNYND